ncbi:DNA internalization-related competence protein ComEC/Rec2 [Diaphorobacter ruginosibacter]|uniref:DNA internalization-related competence protein ComEC/Rec2 n=2 Tax=Diaphorobacter ruginosibacter TaxID=1715720 RepID=A0A7G9RV41_9BURK|nr:DNA internalization-related competence protein ComEC/Rec2 [Diaphorobacter ruginosibacter]
MIGVLLGTAFQLQQRMLWSAEAYVACMTGAGAMLACALLMRRRVGRRVRSAAVHPVWLRQAWAGWIVALAALSALAVFGQIGWRSASLAQTALNPDLEGRDLQVEGVVAAMPQSSERGVKMRLRVESARWRGQPVSLPRLVDLSWYALGMWDDASTPAAVPATLRAGQRWAFEVRLRAPHGGMNPFGFDYELWMWEQGVQANGYVRSGHGSSAPRLLDDSAWRHPVERARQHVRDAILERTASRSPQEQEREGDRQRAAGVVAALVTGDQRVIDRQDWDLFRITGVAHLVSISGLHVTMFAWLAAKVIGALWRRSGLLCLLLPAQFASLSGGVLLAAMYALFSGWGVPSQRTVFMLGVVALLRLGGKRWPWPQVWLIACALVLLWDPWAMLQAGFWLSFVAVGMLFAGGMRSRAMAHRSPIATLALHLRQLLHQQWIVTLALAPLSLLIFGQMSVVGLVVNLLAIPWVSFVVLPLSMLGILWNGLWVPAVLATQLFTATLQWFANWPMAQLALPVAPLWAGVAAALAGMLLALRLPWRVRMLALPCMVPLLWWSQERPEAGRFDLMALDVGQGQAVLVRTARHGLLYDAGPQYSGEANAGERIVVPVLHALGEHIDTLVLSHRDADHTGGAAAVLAAQPQSSLLASLEGGHPLAQLRDVQPCLAGGEWSWDGVRFEVLHPPPELGLRLAEGPIERLRPNAASCVLRVTDAQGVSALLAGDIELAQEWALLAQGALAPVHLLLVPHHGSKTSSSEAFLDALKPRIAVVQAGYRNRFGHPAPAVMGRYRERSVVVAATPVCGAVHWRSDRAQDVGCERERTARYWHHRVPAEGAGALKW